MDDLISRERAIKEAYPICIDGDVFEVAQVETLIGIPFIDAVPVTRCKDCKYYKENTLVCSRYRLEDDDYCSWAERKEK